MKCQGIAKSGNQCGMIATSGNYCRHHIPKTEVFKPEENVMDDPVIETGIEVKETNAQLDKHAIAAKRRADVKAKRNQTGALDGQSLYAPQRKGYKRRWVNGNENRLARVQDKGYTFVEDSNNVTASDDLGNRKSVLVGTNKDGTPRRDYLVEIPEQFYREDQQEKENSIQKTEQMVRSVQVGGNQGLGNSKSTVYDPTGGNNQFDVGD